MNEQVVTDRIVGPDFLAKVAARATGLGDVGWSLLPLERQQAYMHSVAAVLRALTELGWLFVSPEARQRNGG